jgi:hypothetical protein
MGLGKTDLMKRDLIVGLKRYGSRQPYNNKKNKKEKNEKYATVIQLL